MSRKNRKRQREHRREKYRAAHSEASTAKAVSEPLPDDKEPNTACEFYEEGRCLIQMDTGFCSRTCAFATNAVCSTLPYGTKYMRGGRL